MGAFAGLWGEMSYRLGCVFGVIRYIYIYIVKPLRPFIQPTPLSRAQLHTNRLHWRERKVAFGFQLFSACLSLTVGVLWLVLKSLGLLKQVFG
jgi:hypothetical protein